MEQVAELVAISFIPQTWKFLWAPIADTTLSRKTWYLIAAVISAVGIYATGAVPANGKFMPLLYVVVVVSNTAVTFLAMSVESLMVYGTPPRRRAAPEAGSRRAISAAEAWAAAPDCGWRKACRSHGWRAQCSASPACCVASRSCS